MSKIETIVIGINQEFETSLRDYLESAQNIRLLGVEKELASGLELVSQLLPHLVLIDCVYLNVSAGEALSAIRAIKNDIQICLLTMYEDELYKQYAMAQGADDVIPRSLFEQKFEQMMQRLTATD